MALCVIAGTSEGEMPLGSAMAGDATFERFSPAFAEVMGADDDCGRRFPPGDAEAQVAARQAGRAQARVRERFTPERMAGAYLELYDELLAGAGGGGRERAHA